MRSGHRDIHLLLNIELNLQMTLVNPPPQPEHDVSSRFFSISVWINTSEIVIGWMGWSGFSLKSCIF